MSESSISPKGARPAHIVMEWYSHVLWSIAYAIIITCFVASSAPLRPSRRSRFQLSAYRVFYFLVCIWAFAGFLGHTPIFFHHFNFDIDEPASLLAPMWWCGVLTLLCIDLVHHQAEHLLRVIHRYRRRLRRRHVRRWRRQQKQRQKIGKEQPPQENNLTTNCTLNCSAAMDDMIYWLLRKIRTKFRISFGRSFSEAAISSLLASSLCCMLHASKDFWAEYEWMLGESDQFGRVQAYLSATSALPQALLKFANSTSYVVNQTILKIDTLSTPDVENIPEWAGSPIFGIYITLLSLLVTTHLFERTWEVRELFWDDTKEKRPRPEGGSGGMNREYMRSDDVRMDGAGMQKNGIKSDVPRSPSASSRGAKLSHLSLMSPEKQQRLLRSPSAKSIFREKMKMRERQASNASDLSIQSDESDENALQQGHSIKQRMSWQSDDSLVSAAATPAAEAAESATASGSSPSAVPKNKKPMAQWYDYALTQTALDLFMQLNVFGGRFDMRTLLAGNSVPLGSHDGSHGSRIASIVGTPSDPFFHDHSTEQSSMWVDWMADCGDGFDSSYSIARLLAQPSLTIPFSEKAEEVSRENGVSSVKLLPRADVLLIGGDLAYPRPSAENFEERFLRVFEDAMPPPPGHPTFDQEQTVYIQRPKGCDLGREGDSAELRGIRKPPSAYLIPGNHDWFDGLACFLRYVCHRSYLGGWCLPQTRSYFSLRLPHDWWVFGLDNGLNGDIDATQSAYFCELGRSLPQNARVIICTHDPPWVLNQYHSQKSGKMLTLLMDTVLRGKVRLRLAGDVHNYMRHECIVDSNHGSSLPKPPSLVISGGGGAFLHPTHCLGQEVLQSVDGTGGGDYERVVAYPSYSVSASLCIQNLYKFRSRNWRFDIVGGSLYMLMVYPIFTDCYHGDYSAVSAQSSFSLIEILSNFFSDILFSALPRLLAGTTVSGHALLPLIVFICIWTASVVSVDSPKRGVQFWLGSFHAWSHMIAAVTVAVSIDYLLLLLKSHGNLGAGGLHLQWDKFVSRFPGGAVTIEAVGNLTLGIVPAVLRTSMLALDSANTQFLLRQEMCPYSTTSNSTVGTIPSNTLDKASVAAYGEKIALGEGLSLLYFLLRCLWFWMLACPVVATVFASYLYVTVGFLGMHWNEGFSSLQHTGYKNFVRMRVTEEGLLECYAIGLEKSPNKWTLDKEHVIERAAAHEEKEVREFLREMDCKDGGVSIEKEADGDDNIAFRVGAHTWKHPSKWKKRLANDDQSSAKIVDHFILTR